MKSGLMVRNMGRNAVIFANIRMITLWVEGCTALTFHLNCTKIQPYYDVYNVCKNVVFELTSQRHYLSTNVSYIL